MIALGRHYPVLAGIDHTSAEAPLIDVGQIR
jgi:hypothetical protein